MTNMAQRPEAARTNMPQRPEAARIKRYRRFHGYDYSRGASIFVTFALKGRLQLFGRVEGDKVVLSPAGRAALESILFENRRPGRRVWAASFVVMPDHIHIRLVLEPGSGEEPLRHVGQFVNNVKRWSRKHAAATGVAVEWEENYHDHICVSRFINEKVDAYIGYNPLKWSLMHGPDAPLRVVEPLVSQRFPDDEWWSAVGNVGLLALERKITAVSVSRTVRAADYPAIIERLVKAAKDGWVVASTFISPGEIALFKALQAERLPCIKASPDPLKMIYKPRVEDTLAFAEGRLTVISRECSPKISRYDAWHGMNDAMAEMAAASGEGLGVYIHRKGARAAAGPVWERR